MYSWGRMVDTPHNVIIKQLERAECDRAHTDSVFKDVNGNYVVIWDVANEHVKNRLLRISVFILRSM